MAEWLIEQGIGETRALLVDNGEVLAAKLHWPGELIAGSRISARLTSKARGARRGTVTLEDGREVLVDHLPQEATEGAAVEVTISRGSIAERGRRKLAQGRFAGNASADNIEPFANAKTVRSFSAGQWEEIWHAASSGSLEFSGGEIVVTTTPAMTVIDIDGEGSPRALALAAIPAIARALNCFDIGGNIGIDFPTMEAKADRKAVDVALEDALSDWPHERTSMNGFGFVQIIARLEGPSLLHRFATARTDMCARCALRVAERAEGNGPIIELRVHPAINAKLKPKWTDELARRTGKQVRIETDPVLALEAPSAQVLSV